MNNTEHNLIDTRFEEYRSCRHFGSLDGLRCASIIAVIWHHTGVFSTALPGSARGFLGVDLFFVISGFLIVTLLLREKDRAGDISLRKFYIRRALRIFPPYYACLLGLTVLFLFVWPHARMAKPFFENLGYYATYVSNWVRDPAPLGITWSLSTEEQFYLAWPPIAKYVPQPIALAGLVLFIGLNQAVNFRIADPILIGWFGMNPEDYEILQCTFTPICLGVLSAHALHQKQSFLILAPLVCQRWSAPYYCGALLVLANVVEGDIAGWPRLTIQVLMVMVVVSCVAREDHYLTTILCPRLVKRIGAISYGMYLYHLLGRHFAAEAIERMGIESFQVALFPGTVFATIAIAEVSYRFLEQPFLNLKGRFNASG